MKIEFDLRKNFLPVGALCKRAMGAVRGWKPRLRGLVYIGILMLFYGQARRESKRGNHENRI